jgi:Flp pilus assembly protein TadG
MFNQSDAKQSAGVTGYRWRLCRSRIARGQSLTEFALILPLVFIVMLVGVQYAILGQSALALSQGASLIARYAAVNPGTVSSGTASGLPVAAQQLLSPTIFTNGGGDLTVTITSLKGTGAPETGTPQPTVDQCVINLSYSATSKMVLPNNFFGIPLFPTTLSASDSQLYE